MDGQFIRKIATIRFTFISVFSFSVMQILPEFKYPKLSFDVYWWFLYSNTMSCLRLSNEFKSFDFIGISQYMLPATYF